MRYRSLALSASLAVLSLAAVSLTANASLTPQAATARTALPETMSPAVSHSQRQDAVTAGQPMAVSVNLKLRNTAALDRFLTAVSTPGDPLYGQYLTPERFTAEYGPTQGEVDRVSKFLTSQGLTVTGVSANRQVVDVGGTADRIAAAFGTHESMYVDGEQHRTFHANDTPASVPSDLSDVVAGVVGLDDHTSRTARIVEPDASTPAAAPGGYGPAQYDGAYNLDKLGTNGAGTTVALWEFDGYRSSDLTAYDRRFGLSGPAVRTVPVDGANYDARPGGGQGEVELDSEIVRGVAPGAQQLIYEAPNSDQGEVDMAARIVADNKASVISISWGSCEPDTTASIMTAVNNSFKQAAAQGISIFSASGDDGSRDCSRSATGPGTAAVDFPASSPFNTGVGGTNLRLNGNAYAAESAWRTSGGGTSKVFAKPTWQNGTGVNTTRRTVPDIASDADPASGFAIFTQGRTGPGWQTIGGTSAAAPLWAGFAALYDQKAKAAGQAPLGEVNPKLYALAGSAAARSAFHDVTAAGNQDFPARTGYDQVTGWGTPVADQLAAGLLAAHR
ncbi:S53 family serine peptidase [Kitasatospora sp. NPDC086791]|uniref:S53 family peptidase n=1 Tax=Kitasatospora sp. NPDC086791 TaxID=3155178 RepID=UPI00343A0C75